MHQETLLSILSRDFELLQWPGMDYNYQQMPIVGGSSLFKSLHDIVERRRLFRQL